MHRPTRAALATAAPAAVLAVRVAPLRYMPLNRWSTGTYDYVFQHTRRFDRTKPGLRLRSASSAASSADRGYSMTPAYARLSTTVPSTTR